MHRRIVGGIYSKRTKSVRPLTEDFPAYIVNKSLFVFSRRSCYSLSCLFVATENERKSRVGDRPLGINPIALQSSRATECGRIIERIRSKKKQSFVDTHAKFASRKKLEFYFHAISTKYDQSLKIVLL